MANKANARGRGKAASEPKATDEDQGLLLATELEVYESHLPGWLDREGEYVLIKGREVIGFFPTRDDALMTGYTRFGFVPFFVKQILEVEPIYNVGHIEL
jgi:hypothetical protein